MSGYTLNIKVDGGELSADRSVLTADSVEYVVAAFTFDESWSELYKTAIFRVGELVYHTPLENDSCYIPFEALKEPVAYISVFGVLNATRATTTELPIQIKNSGYVACEPQAPAPDPYEYFLQKVTKLKDQATESAELSASLAESVEADKNQVSEMLNLTQIAKEIATSCCETAVQSSDESKESLIEILEHKEFLNDLSKDVQDNADIASEAAERAETSVLSGIEKHNEKENDLAHPNIMNLASEAKSIALGKANSLCFDTETQLNDWVSGAFTRADGKTTEDLKIGDNLYILEIGVPDYWWDGEAIQPLGAEKPDFSDYYTKAQIDGRISNASLELISRNEYNLLYTEGGLDAGRIYFVYEEE